MCTPVRNMTFRAARRPDHLFLGVDWYSKNTHQLRPTSALQQRLLDRSRRSIMSRRAGRRP
jgi:hypothetical protein